MKRVRLVVLVAVVWLAYPHSVQAYIGPGLGAGTLGVVLGFIGSIVLALFGILYYPIKRLIKGLRKRRRQ